MFWIQETKIKETIMEEVLKIENLCVEYRTGDTAVSYTHLRAHET